jgi:CheY-like chemotaxis protein
MSLAFSTYRADGAARRGGELSSRLDQAAWGLDVLLVEDDAADTSLILKVLDQHPGVFSTRASDAPDLLLKQLAKGKLRPDLVLLDIHMPRMDGFKFLRGMRQIRALAKIPVVFLTTSWLARDASDVTHSSAALYVIKPDTYDDLETCLDGVLRRAQSGLWGH